MSDLIMRAEQGVLGALLTGTDPQPITDHLTVTDFGHPAHQAVYSAVLDLDGLGHDPTGLTAAVAVIVDRADVTPSWLAGLAATAPDSHRVQVYVQIVLEAAFDRDTAGFAAPYTTAAELTTDPTARDHLQRLSQALTAQADTFTPAATIDPDSTIDLTGTAGAGTDAAVELHREDQVVADLIQHPDQTREVAAWLDSAVFTTEQRRLAFEIVVSTGYDHDPIDPLIVAWQLGRARAINQLWRERPEPLDPVGEPDYPYLTRLETSPVIVGTAVIVGRDLLTEHVQTRLATTATAANEQHSPEIDQAPQVRQPSLPAPVSAPATVDQPRIQR